MLDGVIVLGVVLVFGASFFLTREIRGTQLSVHIRSADSDYVFPLDTDHTLEVEGPYGTTVIEILNETVRVVDSPGRRKICVRQGKIAHSGAWLICLPNKVFIKIVGAESEIDAYSY